MKKLNITPEEIKREIYQIPIPKGWRQGQFVFNRVEALYGSIAREVQFIDEVDCFYNDEVIDDFINKVYVRLNDTNK